MTSARPASVRGVLFDETVTRLFEAWRELRRGASRLLTTDLYGVGPASLEPTQVDGLELLVTKSEWRMSDLASSLHIDRSTATRMVDRLVAAGVADRSRLGSDRRGIVVRATRKGRVRCSRIVQARQEAMVEYLRDFSEEDMVMLAELMERLIGSVARVARERAGERFGRPAPERSCPGDVEHSGSGDSRLP